jgi:hypothetical protein
MQLLPGIPAFQYSSTTTSPMLSCLSWLRRHYIFLDSETSLQSEISGAGRLGNTSDEDSQISRDATGAAGLINLENAPHQSIIISSILDLKIRESSCGRVYI